MPTETARTWSLKPLFDAARSDDEWLQDTTPPDPQSGVRGPRSGQQKRAEDGGPRSAISGSYWVFVPLPPPVIGVTTTFRNHTTS
jgi:hypothetical protein